MTIMQGHAAWLRSGPYLWSSAPGGQIKPTVPVAVTLKFPRPWDASLVARATNSKLHNSFTPDHYSIAYISLSSFGDCIVRTCFQVGLLYEVNYSSAMFCTNALVVLTHLSIWRRFNNVCCKASSPVVPTMTAGARMGCGQRPHTSWPSRVGCLVATTIAHLRHVERATAILQRAA